MAASEAISYTNSCSILTLPPPITSLTISLCLLSETWLTFFLYTYKLILNFNNVSEHFNVDSYANLIIFQFRMKRKTNKS